MKLTPEQEDRVLDDFRDGKSMAEIVADLQREVGLVVRLRTVEDIIRSQIV